MRRIKKTGTLILISLLLISSIQMSSAYETDINITRADFVTVVASVFDLKSKLVLSDENTEISFSDIDQHIRKDDIILAIKHGIISGYPDKTFRPDRPITREEAAVVLLKALQSNYSTELIETEASVFKDWPQISPWAKSSVSHTALKKLISGFPDNTFKPKNYLTRVETAQIMANYRNSILVITGSSTMGPETGIQNISKDVFITSKNAHLRNLRIEGQLIITEKVGDGDVTLENVTVVGTTYIRGGGANSIEIIGGSYDDIIIERTMSGEIRIVSNLSDGVSVRVTNEADGQKIILAGRFNEVILDAKGGTVEISKEASISRLTVNSSTEITGKGTIESANVNADNVKFENQPLTLAIDSGVTIKPVISNGIPSVTVTPSTPSNPDNGENEQPPVESELITGTLGDSYLTGSTRNVYLASSNVQNDMFRLNIKKYEADEIWALPILGNDYGLWLTDIFSQKTVFPIDDNGKFDIALESLDITQNYIFILVDTTLPDKKDQIQGFVALKNKADGNNLIMMPVHDLKAGLQLGLLNRIGNEAVTELGIQDTADKFKSISVAKLLELAESANALKALKNFYINYNEETGEQYSYNLEYHFGMGNLAFGDYSSFISEYLNGFSVYVRTNRGTDDQKYFRPTGTYVIQNYNDNGEYLGDETYGPDRPFPTGTSFDGALGDGINFFYSYFTPFTNNPILPGYWQFEDASENVLGYFDFSMTPFIGSDNQPLGYIPSLKMTLEGNQIETLDVIWYHNNGNEVVLATDTNLIKSSVKGTYFNHWNSQSFSIGNSLNIPFSPQAEVYLSELIQKIQTAEGYLIAPAAFASEGVLTIEAQALKEAVDDASEFMTSVESRYKDIRNLQSIAINTSGFGVAYTFGFNNPSFEQDSYNLLLSDKETAILTLQAAIDVYIATLQ